MTVLREANPLCRHHLPHLHPDIYPFNIGTDNNRYGRFVVAEGPSPFNLPARNPFTGIEVFEELAARCVDLFEKVLPDIATTRNVDSVRCVLSCYRILQIPEVIVKQFPASRFVNSVSGVSHDIFRTISHAISKSFGLAVSQHTPNRHVADWQQIVEKFSSFSSWDTIVERRFSPCRAATHGHWECKNSEYSQTVTLAGQRLRESPASELCPLPILQQEDNIDRWISFLTIATEDVSAQNPYDYDGIAKEGCQYTLMHTCRYAASMCLKYVRRTPNLRAPVHNDDSTAEEKGEWTPSRSPEALSLELCRRDFFKIQTGASLGHVLIVWPGDTATFVPEDFQPNEPRPAWHSENDQRFRLWRSGSRIQPNRACSHWMVPYYLDSFHEFRVCAELAVQAVADCGFDDNILGGPPDASAVERWLFTLHKRLDADASNVSDERPIYLWEYSDDPKVIETEKAKLKHQWEGVTVSRFHDVRSASLQLIDQLLQEFNDKPVAPDRRETPVWNSELCELSFRGEVIRSIRPIALKPIMILNAFEEEGWPQKVLSPLSPRDNLREAIRTLNTGLDAIEFRADGTTEGIVWAARPL
jgi:hypothetical protein